MKLERRFVIRRDTLLVFLVSLAVLLPAVFWGKFHDDEVLYWDIARNIANGLGPVTGANLGPATPFVWHLPLPSYLAAPFVRFGPDLVAVRLVAAVWSAMGVVALYLVAEHWLDRRRAVMAVLLTISSFYYLRFGGRFYYDPFGFTCFWLALSAVQRRRWLLGGALLALVVLARELWAPTVAVVALCCLWESGRARWRLLLGAVLPVAGCLLWMGTVPGFAPFLHRSAMVAGGAEAVALVGGAHGTWQVLKGLLQIGAAGGVASLGTLAAMLYRESRIPGMLWAGLLAAAGTMAFTPGVLVNGGFTQYPLMLVGFLALGGAAGIDQAMSRLLPPRWRPGKWAVGAVVGLLLAQLLVGSALINRGAQYGSITVYGLGVAQDRAVISLLTANVRPGDRISGVHGAFVPGADWFWVERRLVELNSIQPEWIVTYSGWVDVTGGPGVEHWQVGPYVALHFADPTQVPLTVHPRPASLPGF